MNRRLQKKIIAVCVAAGLLAAGFPASLFAGDMALEEESFITADETEEDDPELDLWQEESVYVTGDPEFFIEENDSETADDSGIEDALTEETEALTEETEAEDLSLSAAAASGSP